MIIDVLIIFYNDQLITYCILDAELNDEIDEQVSNGCWFADQSNHIILFPVKEPVLHKDAVVQFDYWVPMEGT